MICSPPFSDSKVQWPSGSSGTIFGPNYPNPSTHAIGMRSCTWVISVSTGNLVNLTFEYYLYGVFGTNDSVEVLDGQSVHDKMIFNARVPTYGGFGAFGNQFSVYSTGRYMRIKFNFSLSGKVGNHILGLRAHFKATRKWFSVSFPNLFFSPQTAINAPCNFSRRFAQPLSLIFLVTCKRNRESGVNKLYYGVGENGALNSKSDVSETQSPNRELTIFFRTVWPDQSSFQENSTMIRTFQPDHFISN